MCEFLLLNATYQLRKTSTDVCFAAEIVYERVFAYRLNIDIAALKASQVVATDCSLGRQPKVDVTQNPFRFSPSRSPPTAVIGTEKNEYWWIKT